ncbi:hypothetical protein BT63DRAFT_482315 [Microthyrium microscopicum]|uniref:Copper homeostasis protein cutC homolog n=1 Tax=Microthyrium microscopicum TaxID=703497 RepID=A0A6A6U139_9PEZI|nr:hypothetical protein BT63DRAFT_482315 [Microthyrium microscopicum]
MARDKGLLELACFNYESLFNAIAGEADRIEFCADSHLGGTTPKYQDLKRALDGQKLPANVKCTPIHVMIRPRGGSFSYSDEEYNTMQDQVQQFGGVADGFVFGMLRSEDNKVDTERCKALVELAKGKPCTFHRAFDVSNNMEEALDDVEECGFSYILTSGGADKAVDGIDHLVELAEMIERKKYKVQLIIGGGVRTNNLRKLRDTLTSVTWFHTSALEGDQNLPAKGQVNSMKILLNNPSYGSLPTSSSSPSEDGLASRSKETKGLDH